MPEWEEKQDAYRLKYDLGKLLYSDSSDPQRPPANRFDLRWAAEQMGMPKPRILKLLVVLESLGEAMHFPDGTWTFDARKDMGAAWSRSDPWGSPF